MISSKSAVLLGLLCILSTSLAAPQGLIGRLVDPLGILGLNQHNTGSQASAHSQSTALTGGIHFGPIGISGTISKAEANAHAGSHGHGVGSSDAFAQANAHNGIAQANANANSHAGGYNGPSYYDDYPYQHYEAYRPPYPLY